MTTERGPPRLVSISACQHANSLLQGGVMDEPTRRARELDALEIIAAELERLRVL
jgi:hypothetical protein